MSNFTDDELDSLQAYGPSDTIGKSRALLEDLITARRELRQSLELLSTPEVKRALAIQEAEKKLALAKRLQDEASLLLEE